MSAPMTNLCACLNWCRRHGATLQFCREPDKSYVVARLGRDAWHSGETIEEAVSELAARTGKPLDEQPLTEEEKPCDGGSK